MCLICGFVNFEDSLNKTEYILKKLNYRGIDASQIYFNKKIFDSTEIPNLINIKNTSKNNLVLGHNLHSIVSFVKQPLRKNNQILISNCEIYNWENLKEKYNLNSRNDSELILDLIIKFGEDDISKIINELEGVFSFAYFNEKTNNLYLARDLIGEKPLYYILSEKKLAFASEKKALLKFQKDNLNILEFKPGGILKFNIINGLSEFKRNEIYYDGTILNKNYSILKKETLELLEESILKMIPKNCKIGLLFSGGIDSTFIAYILKKNNIDFTCYTASLNGGNIWQAEDLIFSKEIAQIYNLKLKINEISVENLENYIPKIINLIEDKDYVKVSVALPFYISLEKARIDGIKVIFSGLGSEEIFAGYRRHKKVEDINLECLNGLNILHQRDLYRDDVICMANNIELRLPFLDKKLIEYSLKIPSNYKIDKTGRSKVILRDISKDIGLDIKFAERQKKAAQYGSKFDKGLLKLAKEKNLAKQDFINSFCR